MMVVLQKSTRTTVHLGAFTNEAKPSLPEGYKKGEARGMGAAIKGGKYIIAPGE
jgi:hypothetical protein